MATVDAIRTAAIQVLLSGGVSGLTTTRVAERAGVSVGTMYQYFPHKQALLFAILARQLELVEHAVLAAAHRLTGRDLAAIATGLAAAWLEAKTTDIDASRAIYGVAADFDIAELLAQGSQRMRQAIARLLGSAPDARFADLDGTAFMVVALLGGSARAVLEGGAFERDLASLRRELPRACLGYLTAARESGRGRRRLGGDHGDSALKSTA